MSTVPEVVLDSSEADCLVAIRAEFEDLAAIEVSCGGPTDPGIRVGALASLRQRILDTWALHDHVVLRGLPASADGSTGLLVAMSVFAKLKPYRRGQFVKHFRMSPWTTALSHTTASGTFHTDLNTADMPPTATIMQCLNPDPDAPRHGQLRVALVNDLLAELASTGQQDALRFVANDRVTMVNETSPHGWSGTILGEGGIRFHAESLRAAQRRYGTNPPDMESCLAAINDSAIAVSTPIDLASGEILLVSNRRALHQRGGCTVRFREFPREFDSRKVAVLHALDEPA